MSNLDPPDPDPEVIDGLAEILAGKPFKRPAAEGLAAMQRRLVLAEQELIGWEQDEEHPRMVADTKAEIRDLKLRITEYQAQLDGMN